MNGLTVNAGASGFLSFVFKIDVPRFQVGLQFFWRMKLVPVIGALGMRSTGLKAVFPADARTIIII